MTTESTRLRRELRDVGFASTAIDAVWPAWWTEEADASLSAVSELRFTLARRLGLSPESLFEGSPTFVWRGEAKYKNLGTESEDDLAVLSAFGSAVGRVAIAAVSDAFDVQPAPAQSLREAILQSAPFVTLADLLSLCWALGIPVFYLTVFPLGNKRMHAMSVRSGDRYAILIGRASRFPAQVAYLVAHEIGHIMLKHVVKSAALVEIDDPLQGQGGDDEEAAADAYALALLTGMTNPLVESSSEEFSASQLADAAQRAAADLQVDPAILALCLGHTTGQWKEVFGALKILPPGQVDVVADVNAIARDQFRWEHLSLANREYLARILGIDRDS